VFPASRPDRGTHGGVEPLGCSQRAVGLGCTLLRLAKHADRLGKGGEPGDQRDLAEGVIAADEREG